MKRNTPLRLGGARIELERRVGCYKRVTQIRRIPDTNSGRYLDLECGHRLMSFGDLRLLEGFALCTYCQETQ